MLSREVFREFKVNYWLASCLKAFSLIVCLAVVSACEKEAHTHDVDISRESVFCPAGICKGVDVTSLKTIERPPSEFDRFAISPIIPPNPLVFDNLSGAPLIGDSEYTVLYSSATGVCVVRVFVTAEYDDMHHFFASFTEYLNIELTDFDYAKELNKEVYRIKGKNLSFRNDLDEVILFISDNKPFRSNGMYIDFWFDNYEACSKSQPAIGKQKYHMH